MDNTGPLIGHHDEFEALYTERFISIVNPHGLLVKYERDRAALDRGLHLTEPAGEQRRVLRTRIWFQLKGIHKSTLDASAFAQAPDVVV
jgi:hypothetical protein